MKIDYLELLKDKKITLKEFFASIELKEKKQKRIELFKCFTKRELLKRRKR